MPKLAIVAALEREVSSLIRRCRRVEQLHAGRRFVFFERNEVVVVCGGIGLDAARRASEAVIALYHPARLQSVGFAGALERELQVGDLFLPSMVIDARDGSRVAIEAGDARGPTAAAGAGALLSFMAVAGVEQKRTLARAYGARAVDMEAAAVAGSARAHGLAFGATKVISDESTFEIPEIARFIDPQGNFRTASFAAFVALRPWRWSSVARLAGNSRKARTILGEHLERLVEELAHPPVAASSPAPGEIALPVQRAAPSAAGASRTGGRK
jgi:adenosylhomocysteine nucleosidase